MTGISAVGLLHRYQVPINADIEAYTEHAEQAAASTYGPDAATASRAFFDIVKQESDRIHGSMAIIGYDMLGGTDQTMIVRTATALEILHAYIRVLGTPDADAVQRSAALAGAHAAQMLLAGLAVDDALVRKVLGIVNLTMVAASQGNRLLAEKTDDEALSAGTLDHWLQWSVAEPAFLNPLCVGMVLTGADCDDTNAIRPYALAVGKAYGLAASSHTPAPVSGFFHDIQGYDPTVEQSRAAEQAVVALGMVNRSWHPIEKALLTSFAEALC